MQQALFHARFEKQIDTTNRAGLAKVADSIGLSPDLLLNQLDGNGGNAEVDRSIAQGDTYRLDAVPGVIFDGWIKVTELSQENLEKIIDGLLERKNKATTKATRNVHK
jgi:predicted DsbA family dithiol-disulfide isomerase